MVLAMLALFATIGVLAAVVSKVEANGARNFKRFEQDVNISPRPTRTLARAGTFDAQALFAEAMSQIIFGTTNEQSGVRGHSMLENMFGGPAAEARPPYPPVAPNLQNYFPYYGAFNGPGHFAPRDYPAAGWNPVDDPASGITVANLKANPGVIDAAKTAYALFRQRPPGDPTKWSATWKVANNALLQPILPFNYTVFDAVGVAAGGRTATAKLGPAAAQEYPTPEKYWDGARWHYFANDVDYTAADHNNWFLALERGDGQIVIPSFHRPHLVAQLQLAGVFANAWQAPLGRNVILRPRAVDYRAVDAASLPGVIGVRFQPPPNRSIGLPWNDLTDKDGSVMTDEHSKKIAPIIGDSPEELDVDTDGDGLKDSIWLPLGLKKDQLVRLPDGGYAMPQFAIKIISLDGKINLNTAGNFRLALDAAKTTNNNPLHASNLGASPAEINPKVGFILDETPTSTPTTGVGNRIPDWNLPKFYAWMLMGTLDGGGNPVLGRWNRSIVDPNFAPEQPVLDPLGSLPALPEIGPGICKTTAFPASDNTVTVTTNDALRTSVQLWGPYDQFGFGLQYESFGTAAASLNGATQTAFKDVLSLTVNHPSFGMRASLPIAAATPTSLTDVDAKLESGTESVPYEDDQLSTDVEERKSKAADTPFTASNLEKLLRYFDIDYSAQESRLTQLLSEAFDSRRVDPDATKVKYAEREYARNRMRHLFTHSSVDLINMGVGPTFPNTTLNPDSAPEDTAFQEIPPAIAGNRPILHNGRLGVAASSVPVGPPPPNLTTVFTDLVTDVNRGFGDTTNNGSTRYGTRLPIEVRHGRRYNLNKVLATYEGATANPVLADQQRTDMAEQIYVLLWLASRPLDRFTAGSVKYKAANRTIAQIAVNIVDFMDSDEVMTRLVFPDNPTLWVSAPPTVDADHTVYGFEMPRVVINEAVAVRHPRDDGMGTNKDRMWMWAELHNPWTRDANNSDALRADLRPDGLTNGVGAYRLRVLSAGFPATNECKFLEADSIHGGNAALLPRYVVSKGAGPENYYVVGPPSGPDTAGTPPDPNPLLQNFTAPMANVSNGSNTFSANCMYVADAGVENASRTIAFTLYRLRNPFAAEDPTTNPYIATDSVECRETGGEGLYRISGPGAITPAQRFSKVRRRPWQGEAQTAVAGPLTPYFNKEENFLGVPKATVPIDSGFVLSTDGTNANTLGLINGAEDAAVYSTFPFLNRPLASPLELLPLRLYGSHYWATAPSGDANPEWRMRFTDDYQYYPGTHATFPRVWRSRQVPWLLDSELGSAVVHPEFATNQQEKTPNLYRFFEFVECRSLLNGSLDPIADETKGFPKGLGSASNMLDQRRSRVAGKPCLNTMMDEEPFRAVLDAPESMPSSALPAGGNFDNQAGLPTPALHPLNYNLDPFRRVYGGELVGSYWNQTTGYVDFGGGAKGAIFGTPAFWVLPNRQWGKALQNGPTTTVYPGRSQDDLVSSEMFRMFLLSRAGRDGILGTGDDKPFRGFAADHVSDTLLRRRNFRALAYPQDRAVAVPDDASADTEDKRAEYQKDVLHGQYVPRLFDPIGNPFNRRTTGGAYDDANQAGIDHKIELRNKTNWSGAIPAATFATSLPDAENDNVDYWMLERRRNQMLGKIAGNTTTRSNVFGVWVTVGLFRVQAGTEGNLVPLLNEEIGSNTGEQVRHRAFFIVDRSRMDHYDAGMIRSHSLDDDDMKKVIQHYTIIE